MAGNEVGDASGSKSAVGTILMVGLVVLLVSLVGVTVLGYGTETQSVSPRVHVSYSLVEHGDEYTVAITLEGGDAVRAENLYVVGSKPIDVGGPPGSGTPANDIHASDLEKLTESSGDNPPQVGIGETWDAGETIYVDPKGSADGTTIAIYWADAPVTGVNPGTVRGAAGYELVEITVSS